MMSSETCEKNGPKPSSLTVAKILRIASEEDIVFAPELGAEVGQLNVDEGEEAIGL